MTRTTSRGTSDLERSGFMDQIQNIDISKSLSARPSHPALLRAASRGDLWMALGMHPARAQETRRVRITAGGSEDLGVSQN